MQCEVIVEDNLEATEKHFEKLEEVMTTQAQVLRRLESKEEGNMLVTMQRALSLPTRCRRLFAAAGMQILGPGDGGERNGSGQDPCEGGGAGPLRFRAASALDTDATQRSVARWL